MDPTIIQTGLTMWTTFPRRCNGKHCPTSLRLLSPLLLDKSPSPQTVLMLLPVDPAKILPPQQLPLYARLPFGQLLLSLYAPCTHTNSVSWMRKSEPLVVLPALNHCSAPVSIGRMDDTADTDRLPQETLQLMNRNARRGKRANRGKRPCSRQRRRGKRRAFGNHRR
jgi:hypothetical protein